MNIDSSRPFAGVLPGAYTGHPYTLADGCASVGKGWANLVSEAFAQRPPGVEIVQVKEKFGYLRIYHEPNNEAFEKALDDLHDRSGHICEFCGNPGRLTRDNRWTQTLCKRHREERGRT